MIHIPNVPEVCIKRSFLRVVLVLLILLSSGVAGYATTTTATLAPTSYTTTQGSSGGQSVSNMSTMDESGLANDWNNYVEFYAAYANTTCAGYQSFTLPRWTRREKV